MFTWVAVPQPGRKLLVIEIVRGRIKPLGLRTYDNVNDLLAERRAKYGF